MTLPDQSSVAMFVTEKVGPDPRRALHSIYRFRCKTCGWMQQKRPGNDQQNSLILMAHRLDHLEGRVAFDEEGQS